MGGFLDFGGQASGSSQSTATQDATVNFIPTVNESSSPALVSTYPAGQGLSTVNDALPGSVAFDQSLYGTPATAATTTTTTTSSTTTIALIAILGVAAWLFLRKR